MFFHIIFYIIQLTVTKEVKLSVVKMNRGIKINMVQALTKLNPWLIKVTSPVLYLPNRETDESSLLKEIIFWSLYQYLCC